MSTTIDNFNFAGKKALIRVDFNVPINDALQISDNTRITAALPTIKKVLSDGGSAVLMSHLGRPKGERSAKLSLSNVLNELSALLSIEVEFVSDCVGAEAQNAVAALQFGEALLLENLRFHKEEKKGDDTFAKALADLGCDVYVNDAFGTAHRAHASTFTVAKYFEHKMFGYLMNSELNNAKNVLDSPQRPFTAILGGAKVSDKILLIESLLDKVDNLIIGGGMAYTFHKAMGGSIGTSIVELDKVELATNLLQKAKEKGVQLLIPTDTVIADAFANDANTKTVDSLTMPDDWMGLDIGQQSRTTFAETVRNSKTIFWNGPMGVFEMPSFQAGTKAIAEAVAEATSNNGAFSLIGGGDSVAAIKRFGYANKVSYVSTGGGAMLELFEGKELPGVKGIMG